MDFARDRYGITVDPCEVCHKAIADGLKKEQDCIVCNTVRLMPENYVAWAIITRISAHVSIEWLFDLFEIPKWEQLEIYDKILAYERIMIEEIKKKHGS